MTLILRRLNFWCTSAVDWHCFFLPLIPLIAAEIFEPQISLMTLILRRLNFRMRLAQLIDTVFFSRWSRWLPLRFLNRRLRWWHWFFADWIFGCASAINSTDGWRKKRNLLIIYSKIYSVFTFCHLGGISFFEPQINEKAAPMSGFFQLYIDYVYSTMLGSSRPRCFFLSTPFRMMPITKAAMPKQANMTRGHV